MHLSDNDSLNIIGYPGNYNGFLTTNSRKHSNRRIKHGGAMRGDKKRPGQTHRQYRDRPKQAVKGRK